ncbi:MAG: hypothetical protein K1X88_30905 [Nannocystaceae bacterium]|nr:hypothetical protein [Nannocystaceae bacterium]
MAFDLSHLLQTASEHPQALPKHLRTLDRPARASLLDAIANGAASRRLAEALRHCHGKHGKSALEIGEAGAVFLAKTSFPALGAVELHLFRAPSGAVFGRVVTMGQSLLGPAYFGVREGEAIEFDFDVVPGPDVPTPKGWPAPTRNTAGLAGLSLAGTTLVLHGSGDGILSGAVVRGGKDQGFFVNMVRVA